VRGRGLMIGMELNTDGTPVVNSCMEQGFLINCIQGSVLRFVPPLVITREQIDNLVDCLDRLFENMKETK
jgi:acetylornithine/N-succinyldiaminopimelate aminotransferase